MKLKEKNTMKNNLKDELIEIIKNIKTQKSVAIIYSFAKSYINE